MVKSKNAGRPMVGIKATGCDVEIGEGVKMAPMRW
jgi:hypothetical protein